VHVFVLRVLYKMGRYMTEVNSYILPMYRILLLYEFYTKATRIVLYMGYHLTRSQNAIKNERPFVTLQYENEKCS